MIEFGMFAYPWDIAESGPEAFVEQLAEYGVNRLYVATCYHSAEIIVPTRRHRVVVHAEANVAHVPLPSSTFRDLAIPAGSMATENPQLFERLAIAARSHQIQLSAWTIAFHNSRLAGLNPESAIENCFGDRSEHGLCPANRRSVMLATDMVGGLAATGLFESVLLESLSYLLVGHGHPHELWGVRLDTLTRYLLSICFCPSCLRLGGEQGIDGVALRSVIADELHRTWNHPLSMSRNPDDGTELTSRLVLDEDFAAWARMRCSVVTNLARIVTDQAHDSDVTLELSAAVWGRPASLNWTEGIDIRSSASIADRFLLESYYPDQGEVARELDHAVSLADPQKLAMVQTLWPEHHGSLAGLLAKIGLALDAGIESISLYNYAMAPEPIRDWIRAAGLTVRDR